MPKEYKANAKGEVKFDGRALRITTNAICEFEGVRGKPFTSLQAAAKAGEVEVRDMRALVYAAGGYDTEREAGDAIEEAGGFAALGPLVGALFEAAFPTPDKSDKPDAEAEPGEA